MPAGALPNTKGKQIGANLPPAPGKDQKWGVINPFTKELEYVTRQVANDLTRHGTFNKETKEMVRWGWAPKKAPVKEVAPGGPSAVPGRKPISRPADAAKREDTELEKLRAEYRDLAGEPDPAWGKRALKEQIATAQRVVQAQTAKAVELPVAEPETTPEPVQEPVADDGEQGVLEQPVVHPEPPVEVAE